MKTNEFQYQCDFCLNVIYTPKVKKKKKGYGFFGVHEMFLVSDTMGRKELHICPKCLKKELGMEYVDELKDVKND